MATYGVGALLVIIGFVISFQFVEPAPPREIRIAAGASDGAYFRFAQAYGAELAREGIRLEVVETAGSVENLERLRDPEAGIDLAIVQGGVPQAEDADFAYAIGSVFYEPVWLLQRGGDGTIRLNDFEGTRIGVGPVGSGTRFIAARMLAANGVTAENAELVSDDLEPSSELLSRGDLDVLFMVTSADSPLLRRLIGHGDIHVGHLERAPAFARIDNTLSALRLPEGSLNLTRDIPQRDIDLVATRASLIARKDLHPALVDLLIQAAGEVHGDGGLFAEPGEFPSPDHTDLPLSPDAERHYQYGPPFLQRYLPFWAATLADRLKIMLLPLIGLMFPLFKALPPVLRWRIRSRIYRWYSELREIDLATHDATHNPKLRERLEEGLERMEQELEQVEVPLSYADQLYNLRLHVQLVRQRLRAAAS